MTRARVLLVTLVLLALSAPPSPRASAQVVTPVRDVHALVFIVPGVSFEQLLAVPEVRALARAGGAALMSSRTSLTRLLRESFPDVHISPLLPNLTGTTLQIERNSERVVPLHRVGEDIRSTVGLSPAHDFLVIVATDLPSPSMLAVKDELTPIVLASGDADELFPSVGPLHTLGSHTTRRTGVVSDEDVVPTILDFLDQPIPRDLGGSVLVVMGRPAPFDLHARYLAMRRMSVPVQAAAGIYVTAVGLVAIALLALQRQAPAWLAGATAWLSISVAPLAVALLAAGHLPALSYATVVPFVVALTLVGTLAFMPLRRFGALVPPAAIGVAVLVYFAVEAALGWTAALTPFLGGSQLDGGRFYGLPNVFISLLIGSSLYVAQRLEPVPGFLLVAAVGLFAGLPWTGANLGGSVALFAAAGLWLPLRRTGWIGPRGLAVAALVVVGGAAAVLLAHRFLTSVPTHVTRFAESPGGLAGAWGTFVDRLLVGWRLILRNPFALVPVLGLFAVLWVLFHPPARIAGTLRRHAEWSDALLVTLLASIVAYVANDSGAAAAGLGFGLALGGLLHVSLSERTWKMEAT